MERPLTRPRSIERFEHLYLLAIVMETIDITFDWASLWPSYQYWVRIGAVVISLSLVLLASRRRQRLAGLVLSALFVIGLPMVATALGPDVPFESSILIVTQVALQAVALIFLFKPASRAWFAAS